MTGGGLPSLSEPVIAYRGHERILMRLLFALILFDSIPWDPRFADLPNPHGLARLVNLGVFLDPGLLGACRILSIVALIAYVAGFLPVVGGGLVLLIATAIGTVGNSQGAIGHSTQLVVMVLLGQWIAHGVSLARTPVGRRLAALLRPDAAAQNLAIHASKLVICAAYLASALSKIIDSDGQWIRDVPYLAVQMTKSNQMEFFNSLEPVADQTVQIASMILAHPWAARLLFGAGLGIEFFCLLAMLGRAWAFGVGLALVAMHLSISAIMGIDFDSHIALVIVFFLNLPGLPAMLAPLIRRCRDRRPIPAATP